MEEFYISNVEKYDEKIFELCLLLINKVKGIYIQMNFWYFNYYYTQTELQVITKFARNVSDIEINNLNFNNVSKLFLNISKN